MHSIRAALEEGSEVVVGPKCSSMDNYGYALVHPCTTLVCELNQLPVGFHAIQSAGYDLQDPSQHRAGQNAFVHPMKLRDPVSSSHVVLLPLLNNAI